jgi:DNA mismatch endonuclease (patch repair protein)
MDTFSKKKRSEIMSKVKSSGNRSTEMKMIEFFKKYEIKGWRRNSTIPGKPDFIFPKAKIAVFIDGCYWHGCPQHCRMPSSNQDYWQKKIARNIKRDKEVTKELRKKNWTVIRIWEHELKTKNKPPKIRKIEKAILENE